MISRAACVPRICLACRLNLSQRTVALGSRAYRRREALSRRFYADLVIQDKSRVEALISGKTELREKPKPKRKARSFRRDDEEDLPDWGLKKPENTHEATSRQGVVGKGFEDFEDFEDFVDFEGEDGPEAWNRRDIISELQEFEEEELGDVEEERQQPPKTSPPEEMEAQSTITERRRIPHELLLPRQLGVNALGQPVEALVMKNPNKMRPTLKSPTKLREQRGTDSKLYWKDLIADRVNEDPESPEAIARRNIEELRPTKSNMLRMKDFETLVQTLTDGFTTIQLQRYHKTFPEKKAAVQEETPDYPWLIKQISWKASKTLPRISQTPKHLYAQNIVLKNWGILIQEYEEDLGRAFYWVLPELFPLLIQGSQPVIEGVRRDFLDQANGETLTSTEKACRLNITARKSTVSAILAWLDETFQRLRYRTLPLLPNDRLQASEEAELMRITNTSIWNAARDAKSKRMKVFWLEDQSLPESTKSETGESASSVGIEDPADVVLRLLLGRAVQMHNWLSSDLQKITSSRDQTAEYVVHHREIKSMGWRDKVGTWARLVSPISKTTSTEAKPLQLSERVVLPIPQPTRKDAVDITTVTFGHILRKLRANQKFSTETVHRPLSPVIPHPASFSSLKADDNQPLAQSTAIILNFAPVSGLTDVLGKKIPIVRLRLPITEDTDLSNFKLPAEATLKGVVTWHGSDILLPSESVDVRLEQQHVFPLNIQQQSLQEFLSASEFNLLEGRLRTPPRVDLTIPGHHLAKRVVRSKIVAPITVSYIFRGLEIHQTTEMVWRGNILRYNSIEAGQHGGQRQELTLQAGSSEQSSPVMKDEAQKNFLQLVEEVATGEHFSWDEGYKAFKAQRFEDYSYDLPEEKLPEDVLVYENAKARGSRASRWLRDEDPQIYNMPKAESHDDILIAEEAETKQFEGSYRIESDNYSNNPTEDGLSDDLLLGEELLTSESDIETSIRLESGDGKSDAIKVKEEQHHVDAQKAALETFHETSEVEDDALAKPEAQENATSFSKDPVNSEEEVFTETPNQRGNLGEVAKEDHPATAEAQGEAGMSHGQDQERDGSR